MARLAFPTGARARLAVHLSALCIVGWAAASATRLKLPGLPAEEAREVADRFEEHRRTGEFRSALSGVRRLLKSYPDRPEYLQAEAELLTQLGDSAGAAASWEAFMAVAPFPADACPHIGLAYDRSRSVAKALDAHRRCYETDPTNGDLASSYAAALTTADRFAEAERIYEQILKRWPGYTDALIGLLRLKFKQDRSAEVASLLSSMLKAGKRTTDVLAVAARLARERGDRPAAKAYLAEAIQVAPDYPDLYRELAELQDADRDWPEAIKTYRALLAVAPGDARARKRLRELEGLR
ncbi:MAG: tetratricopeptide repeat protein [Elusimicrobiota bacterium]|jgi:tetratricopeptide (TPR) repeat protein